MPVLSHLGHLSHDHHWIGVAVAIGTSLFVAAIGAMIALRGRNDRDD